MPELAPAPIMTDAKSILATDCGSTTTKAILIEQQANGEYRLMSRGEAPTTVEAPFDDVTVGVTNAVREIEELTGKTIIGPDGKVIDARAKRQSRRGFLSFHVVRRAAVCR